MNIKEFVFHGLGMHSCCPKVTRCSSSMVVPGQACSVRELFRRQQLGLPLPPMTTGFVFNGLSIDELPESSGRYADRSDVINELSQKQKELREKGLTYRVK